MVAPHPTYRDAAVELFELFKIPWTFNYEESTTGPFAATLVSSTTATIPEASVIVCAGPTESPIDRLLDLRRVVAPSELPVQYGPERLKFSAPFIAFDGRARSIGLQTVDGRQVGVIVNLPEQTVVRLGYDLFAEVAHLLEVGQPSDQALSPSVELHIAILRDALLACGMPIVELPPSPHNHPFIACLTHDIDFIGIKHHLLDRTFAGFVLRVFQSLFGSAKRDWVEVKKNFAALCSVPAVFLRLVPDFWYPISRYSTAEGELPSTYFFIPFRGRPGIQCGTQHRSLRAAPYDVTDYASDLRELERAGREVAVHGIDAWSDVEAALEERAVIQDITKRNELGIRMHWLYFSEESPKILEDAGYTYDSTLGFNDAVGFRNGTTQVFRPKGARSLLELPLNVQDTAMMFPARMQLSEADARGVCQRLISILETYGGVLTINWHDRSMAPERNWDVLYRDLLVRLRGAGAWFATGSGAVSWFRRRRDVQFTHVTWSAGQIHVAIRNVRPDCLPPVQIRVSQPNSQTTIDIPIHASGEYIIDLQQS